MAVTPDSDGNRPRTGENNEMSTFLEHLGHMGSFLKSHQSMLVIRLLPIHRMVQYDVRYNISDTGGNMFPLDHTDWPILLPLREVTRHYIYMN